MLSRSDEMKYCDSCFIFKLKVNLTACKKSLLVAISVNFCLAIGLEECYVICLPLISATLVLIYLKSRELGTKQNVKCFEKYLLFYDLV